MTYDLMKREADKYRKVWDDPSYRKVAPGMFEVERAFERMGCATGETLNDYGCGTGRATKWFQDHGLEVLGIDHADNACEEDVPVLLDCLWDMTTMVPRSDYGFCCDVMEHIPPAQVDAVLDTIARLTKVCAWFRIATR
jgi:trans-aconitate methyltransferase